MDLRDPVSSASHLATAVWAVFATLVMLRLTRGGLNRKLAVGVFGLSMVLLYFTSGMFHALHYDTPEQKRFFQRLDQSAIFLLIAGTNTPVIAFLLEGRWRRWWLGVIWGIALLGIACLWLLPKAPHALTVGTFLGLGWAGGVPIVHYYRLVGWRVMNWVWLGAGLYTGGAVCELTQWPVIVPGWVQAHEVFHFCDMAASIAFFLLVVRHVIPYRKRPLGCSLAGVGARGGVVVGGGQGFPTLAP